MLAQLVYMRMRRAEERCNLVVRNRRAPICNFSFLFEHLSSAKEGGSAVIKREMQDARPRGEAPRGTKASNNKQKAQNTVRGTRNDRSARHKMLEVGN